MTIIADGQTRTITPTYFECIAGEWFEIPRLLIKQAE